MLLTAFNVNLEHEPVFLAITKTGHVQTVSVYRTVSETHYIVKMEMERPSIFRLVRKPVSDGISASHVDVMEVLTHNEIREMRSRERAKWGQPPQIQGPISSDTTLMSDILPKMHDAMMALYDQYGAHERVDASYAQLRDIEIEFRVLIERDDNDDPDNLLGDIYDEMYGIINSFLPEGWVFGTSEGDGACLGIWDYTN